MIRTILAFLLPLSAYILFPNPAYAQVKVGFIGIFGGPGAPYGVAARNGFELGLRDSPGCRLLPIYEDSEFVPAKAVAAAKKLIEIDKVSLVSAMGSTLCNAVAPYTQHVRVPLVAWANDPAVGANRNLVLLTEPPATDEGLLAAHEARRRGYDKVAIVIAEGDYHKAVMQGLTEGLGSSRVLMVQTVLPGDQDFRAVAVKTAAARPSAVGLCLQQGQFAVFAAQLRQSGFQGPIFGCNTMQDRSEYEQSKGALEGAWFIGYKVDAAFVERYEREFGNSNVVSGAAFFYRTARLLCDRLREGLSAYQIMDALVSSPPMTGPLGQARLMERAGVRFMTASPSVQIHSRDGLLKR